MKAIVISALLAVFGTAASAQSLGVRLAEMPVGTKIYYEDYDGDSYVDEFKGRRGKYYVFRRSFSKENFSYRRYYTLDGHYAKATGNSNYSITYSPHDCEQILGSCSYTVRGSRTGSGKYMATLKKVGSKYEYNWRSVKTNETYDSTLTFGKYNLITEESWIVSGNKKRWRRIVKIQ